MHHDRAHDGSREAQHRRKEQHDRDPDDRRQPPAAEAQQKHRPGDQRHVQAGHRHHMGNAHKGHLIFCFIGQPAAVARQKRPQEALRIRRKERRDPLAHGLRRHSRIVTQRYLFRRRDLRFTSLEAEQADVLGRIVEILLLSAAAGNVRHLRCQAQRVAGAQGLLPVQIQEHPAAVQPHHNAAAVFRHFREVAYGHGDLLFVTAVLPQRRDAKLLIAEAPQKPRRQAEQGNAHALCLRQPKKAQRQPTQQANSRRDQADLGRKQIHIDRRCRRKSKGKDRQFAHIVPPSR